MRLFLSVVLLAALGLPAVAYGHTVDAVGEYRVEIGWMNEPVVSGETNAIEFYASPLIPCTDISEPIKCAESQEFEDGVSGLNKTVKMKLIYKNATITLPLVADHDIAGKYYAFVNPTVSGFYQANILGTIVDTPISLSMHPPKVGERSYIEFPRPSDSTTQQLIDSHATLAKDVDELKKSVTNQDNSGVGDWLFPLLLMFATAVIVGVIVIVRSSMNQLRRSLRD